jgi:hypothetical protein
MGLKINKNRPGSAHPIKEDRSGTVFLRKLPVATFDTKKINYLIPAKAIHRIA